MEVSASMQIPSGICWDTDGTFGPGGIYTETADIGEGGGKLHVVWKGGGPKFQVQWRTRSRIVPSKSNLGGEEWTAWPEDWTDKNSLTTTFEDGKTTYLHDSFDIAYNFAEYDAHEYQFRVRSVSADGTMCSEWASKTLKVRFRPKWEITGGVVRYGGLTISVAYDNPRNAQVCVQKVSKSDGTKLYSGNVWVDISNGVGAVSFPSIVCFDDALVVDAKLKTYDESVFQKNGQTIPITIEDYGTLELSVSFADVPLGTKVEVRSNDTGCSDAEIVAEWDDLEGEHRTEVVKAMLTDVLTDESGIRYIAANAVFKAAPVGIPVTYHIRAHNGHEWANLTEVHTAAPDGRIVFIDGKDVVVLRYNASRSEDYAPASALIKLASRENPVSRYGVGGIRKLSAKGDVLSKRVDPDGCWLQDVSKLKRARTWTYRDSVGNRMRVSVTSVSIAMEHPDIASVSLSMTEVE